MKNFIKVARESVSTYGIVGNEEIIELQHLLAVIIGGKAEPEICGKLSQFGLRELVNLSVYELESIGLTHNEALRLHSAIVLAKKLNVTKPTEGYVIKSPEDAANYLMEEMRFLNQEHFVVLFLNTKNVVIKKKTIFIGSLNASIVHPREVYHEAVKHSAASIICSHNHRRMSKLPV